MVSCYPQSFPSRKECFTNLSIMKAIGVLLYTSEKHNVHPSSFLYSLHASAGFKEMYEYSSIRFQTTFVKNLQKAEVISCSLYIYIYIYIYIDAVSYLTHTNCRDKIDLKHLLGF